MPNTTIVVCFVFCWYIKSHYCKQDGPRSDCSSRSSLIWVHTVCLYARSMFEKFARRGSRRHKKMTKSDVGFLGILRVYNFFSQKTLYNSLQLFTIHSNYFSKDNLKNKNEPYHLKMWYWGIYRQQRSRSAHASLQVDQSLQCMLTETLDYHRIYCCTVKALIRLCGFSCYFRVLLFACTPKTPFHSNTNIHQLLSTRYSFQL